MGPAGLPIMLRLDGRAVLVVGGGSVAVAKARLLAGCGAQITMVAPAFSDEALALDGVVRHRRRYRPADLAGCWLVITAIDDPEVTAAIAADAERAGIFCNAADRPASCSATLMATFRDGDAVVAVSTNGRSPAAAAWLRDRVRRQLAGSAGVLVARAAEARDRLRGRRSSEGLDWSALLDELDAVGTGADPAEVAALIDRFVDGAMDPAPTPGRVVLVGAGPGDPDLLTVAGARALAQADVVVHDALVGDGVLELVAPGAELIDVGKRPGAAVAQELISALLVELARAGRRVVRLKGGDPYLFGRGGEEVQALQRAGIAFEVLPGVSSALAAPARAGVPVTQRAVSAAVTVITGHRAADIAPVDWEAAARLGGTLVVLMGVTERGAIADALQRGGLDPATPVAVIERASRVDERVQRSTLDGLGALEVQAPATIVIGAVAGIDLRPDGEAALKKLGI